jgi:hypothetical protein
MSLQWYSGLYYASEEIKYEGKYHKIVWHPFQGCYKKSQDFKYTWNILLSSSSQNTYQVFSSCTSQDKNFITVKRIHFTIKNVLLISHPFVLCLIINHIMFYFVMFRNKRNVFRWGTGLIVGLYLVNSRVWGELVFTDYQWSPNDWNYNSNGLPKLINMS